MERLVQLALIHHKKERKEGSGLPFLMEKARKDRAFLYAEISHERILSLRWDQKKPLAAKLP